MSESNGYLSPFIGDGYDRTAVVGAVEGLWSKVRIRYRLAAAHEVSGAYLRANLSPGEPPIKFHAPLLAEKIIGWDIKDQNGKAVERTAANIEQLNYGFYNTLRSVVYGELPAEDDVAEVKHETAEQDAKN
jgi:hypothetical protein